MNNCLLIGIPAVLVVLAAAYIVLYNRLQRLRIKVEENPKEPVYIRTVFGLGYKWEDGES